MYVQGCVHIPQTQRQTPLPHGQNDACENITLPKLCLRAVIKLVVDIPSTAKVEYHYASLSMSNLPCLAYQEGLGVQSNFIHAELDVCVWARWGERWSNHISSTW